MPERTNAAIHVILNVLNVRKNKCLAKLKLKKFLDVDTKRFMNVRTRIKKSRMNVKKDVRKN